MTVRYDLLRKRPERTSRAIEQPPSVKFSDQVRFPVVPARVARRAEDRSGFLDREGLDPCSMNPVQLGEGMPERRRLEEVEAVRELEDRIEEEVVRLPGRRLENEPRHSPVTADVDPILADRIPDHGR